jgi:hypothetical protein
MNTTAAALQAHVTTATIRAWARRGVIAATKTAGRWIINAASLTHRIAIAAMRTRKATVSIDLNATYTYTPVGETEPVTLTPVIKTRTTRDGMTLTTIRRLAPLLANHINAITDEGTRLHVLTLLERGIIVIADQPRPDLAHAALRDEGRIATTYLGVRALPVDVVLDLAEQIRTKLASGQDAR